MSNPAEAVQEVDIAGDQEVAVPGGGAVQEGDLVAVPEGGPADEGIRAGEPTKAKLSSKMKRARRDSNPRLPG